MLGLPLHSSSPESYDKAWVAGMFTSGEQGAWYEPSLSNGTLFQDAAGTIPVTAVEQPVGLMRDLSGRGNHATQVTSANRPVLSARYNLLTKTEQFDVSSEWGTINASVLNNAGIDPLGGNTADLLVASASTGLHGIDDRKYSTLARQAISYTQSIYAKAGGYNFIRLKSNNGGGTEPQAYFNLSNGTIGTKNSTVIAASIKFIADGWYLCSISYLSAAITDNWYAQVYPAPTNGVSSYTGDGVSGVYIWGASFLSTNQAHLPYQRVDTATSYDADPIKFPAYLRFNGTNSWMRTGNIDFTGTDKMTVVAGLRKTVDQIGLIAESSSGLSTGSFGIAAYGNIGPGNRSYTSTLVGSSTTGSMYNGFVAPISNVLTFKFDIANADATSEIITRIDGKVIPSLGHGGITNSAGTGNLGTYPLYIGARAGTGTWFNGQIHSLIIRGAQTDAAHITHAEKFVAYKTGINI